MKYLVINVFLTPFYYSLGVTKYTKLYTIILNIGCVEKGFCNSKLHQVYSMIFNPLKISLLITVDYCVQ